ncbi:unnamed protein product [Colletotrichum noveboracense]|uniref:Uncharacterized protein n=1 Tax=Colletotrichum noveboracense TaxID=2664923 RepID=A0A9W4WPR8_9PEZI|nr:unnamed protein product [Colletotrichum noveboracense]
MCLVQFPTHNLLQQHVWHYQTEIAVLLMRLHDLFAHHDPQPNTTNSTYAHNSLSLKSDLNALKLASNAQPSAFAAGTAKFISNEQGPINEIDLANQQKTSTCPQCPAVLARKQDLERYYIICKTPIFYSNTFTRARKYITYRCTKGGSQHQQSYIKRRCLRLCAEAKQELHAEKNQIRCPRETVARTTKHTERTQTVGKDALQSSFHPSRNAEVAYDVRNDGLSLRLDEIAFAFADSGLNAAYDAKSSGTIQLHPPLFIPPTIN